MRKMIEKAFLSALVVLVISTLASAEPAKWSKGELVGSWRGEIEGVDVISVMNSTHVAYVLVVKGRQPIAGEEPTEAELAGLYKASAAALAKYELIEPNRWHLEYLISADPAQEGQELTYEYEWLDDKKTRMQFWVLDDSGERTEETGFSSRVAK